jgi:hypothetical protein
MRTYFGQNLSKEDLLLTRAKLAVARYFQDANTYINAIANIFAKRIETGKAIGDIADVYGKGIDEQKVANVAQQLLESGQVTAQMLETMTSNLSQDERTILLQYINLFQLYKSGNSQLQNAINNILGQSLGGSSQIIVLELL